MCEKITKGSYNMHQVPSMHFNMTLTLIYFYFL